MGDILVVILLPLTMTFLTAVWIYGLIEEDIKSKNKNTDERER